MNIICTHLSNQTYKRNINWPSLLSQLNSKKGINNYIIIGDFNAYRYNDYSNMTRLKLLKDRYPHDYSRPTRNNPDSNFFSLIKKIEDNGYTDAFVKHAQNHNIPEEEQWKKIPANTSYHGGRVDYMFFSPKWDDNELPIAGVYKIYDNSSDHSPMLLDLYTGK